MDNLSISAFGVHLDRLNAASGGGLNIREWDVPGIAAVMAAGGRQEAAASLLAAFAHARPAHVLHSGPGHWLVLDERPTASWPDDLAAELGGLAEVFDQSSGYALLTLAGRDARTLLQKGIFVDLDAALGADGMSLGSMIAHISVTVWRWAPEVFGVAVPRSYAGSFWHWLEAVAAAEGIRLCRTR